MTWRAISGFRLVTADLDRAAAFYAALGFSLGGRAPISDHELSALGIAGGGCRQPMILGPSRVDLDRYDESGQTYPTQADAASLLFQHLALVTDHVDAAWKKAERAGARPISRGEPVTLPQSAGGVTAIKFRDPDGHPLELIRFPDSAARGWNGQGLLGIDHSALSVKDVAASRRFYRAKGLTEEPGSLNRGPTQDTLDGLDAVEVDVAPFRPETSPPHLEMLAYRQPRGLGCGPVAPNDIAATRVVWRAERDALVRDPDGHLHQLERG